jgi:large subunit ribosomal protein L25
MGATSTQSAAPKSLRKAASNGIVSLDAKPRAGSGKGEARRLRRAGSVPAIAYGKGLASTLLAVSPKEILAILTSERGQNSVLEMELPDAQNAQSASGAKAKTLLMIKDYSYHPVHRGLEHVDFVQVRLDQAVDVNVPLVFHGKPAGVTAGGIIRQVYRTVPVHCVPDKIPLKLEIDIAHLELGEHVATSDLKLPDGVTVRLPAEQTLIAVVTPEKEREEDVAVDAAAAAAAGAAAAPGAPGAAPAAGAEAGKDAKPGAAPAAAPAKDAKKK